MIKQRRPDPANVVQVNTWLMDHIEALERERMERRVSASEAARLLGYSAGYFHGKPWRVPGFGLRGYLHSLADWKAWDGRPEAERREEWEAMGTVEKRKARGLTA